MMIFCDQCKEPIVIHAIVDSEVWERIAKSRYALCPLCIDAELEAAGLTAECDLLFVGGSSLRSIRTTRVERAGAWRPREMCAQESAGLDSLFRNNA